MYIPHGEIRVWSHWNSLQHLEHPHKYWGTWKIIINGKNSEEKSVYIFYLFLQIVLHLKWRFNFTRRFWITYKVLFFPWFSSSRRLSLGVHFSDIVRKPFSTSCLMTANWIRESTFLMLLPTTMLYCPRLLPSLRCFRDSSSLQAAVWHLRGDAAARSIATVLRGASSDKTWLQMRLFVVRIHKSPQSVSVIVFMAGRQQSNIYGQVRFPFAADSQSQCLAISPPSVKSVQSLSDRVTQAWTYFKYHIGSASLVTFSLAFIIFLIW